MNNIKLISTKPPSQTFNIVMFPRGCFGVMVRRPDPLLPTQLNIFTDGDPNALVFRTLSGDLIRLSDGDRWSVNEIENYNLTLADKFQIRELREDEVIQIGITPRK